MSRSFGKRVLGKGMGALAAALSMLPAASMALTSDRQQPMHIEADHVRLDDKRDVSVYKGNVVAAQGSLRVTAATLTVYLRDGKLQKLLADGGSRPATYRQRPDNQDQDIQAEAQHIEYFADQGTAILTNHAVLRQGGNTFASNRIVYDLNKDKVNAGSQTGKDRVRITIQPQTLSPAAKPKQ